MATVRLEQNEENEQKSTVFCVLDELFRTSNRKNRKFLSKIEQSQYSCAPQSDAETSKKSTIEAEKKRNTAYILFAYS